MSEKYKKNRKQQVQTGLRAGSVIQAVTAHHTEGRGQGTVVRVVVSNLT
jgi:hypothetical protein